MIVPALWLAQCLTFAAGIYGPWRDAPEIHAGGRVARPIRMAIAASLVLAAALVWAESSDGPNAIYAKWVTAGMFASFIGDLVMARLIPVPNRLLGGMVAFGIGHTIYIRGYAATLEALTGTAVPAAWITAGVLYTVLNIAGWWKLVRNPAKPLALNIGALLYGTWIGIMAAGAFAVAWTAGGGYWLAALGGVVFITSDLLIGLNEIRGHHFENANDWVWFTYIAGQMGIIYSGWFAG